MVFLFFIAFKSNKFAKSAAADILRAMCNDKGETPESAVAKLNLQKISGKSLAKLISDEKLDFPSLMAKYRLRVDAGEAQEIYKKK